jgi:hypothetical protein
MSSSTMSVQPFNSPPTRVIHTRSCSIPAAGTRLGSRHDARWARRLAYTVCAPGFPRIWRRPHEHRTLGHGHLQDQCGEARQSAARRAACHQPLCRGILLVARKLHPDLDDGATGGVSVPDGGEGTGRCFGGERRKVRLRRLEAMSCDYQLFVLRSWRWRLTALSLKKSHLLGPVSPLPRAKSHVRHRSGIDSQL